MKRIYVCSDTVTGILSAIYDAWKREKNSENLFHCASEARVGSGNFL